MLIGKQKRYLRSLAMTMKPQVIFGKSGLSDTFVDGLVAALEAHELIKINLLPAAEMSAKELGEALAARVNGLEVAQTIGRTLLVYRQSSDVDKQDLSRKLEGMIA